MDSTSTNTQTYTTTDVKKVFEAIIADIKMIATRTQAMFCIDYLANYQHDLTLLATCECLKKVHVQLIDSSGERIRANEYVIQEEMQGEGSCNPGGNKWPVLPSGRLSIILILSDSKIQQFQKLQEDNRFEIEWGPTNADTSYTGMEEVGQRAYSSNDYGCVRRTFSSS